MLGRLADVSKCIIVLYEESTSIVARLSEVLATIPAECGFSNELGLWNQFLGRIIKDVRGRNGGAGETSFCDW